MTSGPTAPSNRDVTGRDDHELLAEFVRGSEAAFAALVRRHIDAVHSAALRQVRDPHTAADVTSAAFIVLARKAASLNRGIVIPAWLHRTTRYAALKAVRAQVRRQRYEQEAARMQNPSTTENLTAVWEEVAPLLDDGLTQLPAKDHEAVVLRFFQRKTFPEIAALIGGTEEGARKRVDRAVEKLRGFFTRHGVAMPAAVLAATLAVHSVQASPLALAGSISALGAGTAAPPLVAQTLRALRWRLWKQIAAGLAFLMIVSGVLFFARPARPPDQARSPIRTFRLLTQAANDGDGARWSSFVNVSTAEERQARTLLASNVAAQAELRRALIQRFGPAEYEASGFPRLLDDTPESQISAATERIAGNQAVVHLPRGSNLKFVLIDGSWKFDFFRTTTTPSVQLLGSAASDFAALTQLKLRVIQGSHRNVEEVLIEFQRRR